MIDDTEGQFGLERMTASRYYTAYNVRRPSQAPIKFDTWSTMQLPVGSIFHTMNGWETLDGSRGGLPDPTLPPLVNEKLPIYLKINTAVATDHSGPFGVKESYSYRPNTIIPQIAHFSQTHRKFHRILSDRQLATMSGVLTLHLYRKFDIIIRTILDLVSAIGAGKQHYILLPQGTHVFARSILQRSFKDLSTGTLNGLSHDPSIFPMIHLLAYVYGKNHELSVSPYKEDVKLLGKQDPLFETLKSTSLLERLDKNLFSSINFILQKDDKAIVYNLADLDKFADNDSFYQKFYRHIMNLRLSHSKLPDGIDPDSEEFDDYVADGGNKDTGSSGTFTETELTARADQAIRSKEEKGIPLDALEQAAKRSIERKRNEADDGQGEIPLNHEPVHKNFEERLRAATIDHTAAAIDLEPKKETKRNSLMENHLKVVLNGKALGELIQPPSVQAITPKDMTFITSAPEASYQKSSLVAMDKAYQTHSYHHDMAKVVGSLSKHGLFITKVEEDKIHTEMDRTTTYRFHVSDLNGKSHHIKYTLPDVDTNGIMKLSGINYRLTRQIANVPICKTSPTRVNLSSYYNKIIVERVQSKRYSYENDTAKLILSLKAKGKLDAIIGQAPLPTKKLDYDYSEKGPKNT